ncbi:MAG: hypothetical protein ABL949_12155 [Fimbriimonadaceae bacterium]
MIQFLPAILLLILNAQMGGETVCLNSLFWSSQVHLGVRQSDAKCDPVVLFVQRDQDASNSARPLDAPDKANSDLPRSSNERVFDCPFVESARSRDGPAS